MRSVIQIVSSGCAIVCVRRETPLVDGLQPLRIQPLAGCEGTDRHPGLLERGERLAGLLRGPTTASEVGRLALGSALGHATARAMAVRALLPPKLRRSRMGYHDPAAGWITGRAPLKATGKLRCGSHHFDNEVTGDVRVKGRHRPSAPWAIARSIPSRGRGPDPRRWLDARDQEAPSLTQSLEQSPKPCDEGKSLRRVV
jgi:hypothetical protein